MAKKLAAAVGLLIGMQVVGEALVWDALWSGRGVDAHEAAAAWFAWTGVQVALGIGVGIGAARFGLRLARGAARRRRAARAELGWGAGEEKMADDGGVALA